MSISADSERETPHSSESMDKDNGINLKPLTRVTVRYRSLSSAGYQIYIKCLCINLVTSVSYL